MLGFICAPWEGSRLLHLAMAMVRAMLPWTFAIDKHKYGSYLSVYTQMTGLEIYHLEMHDHLKIRGFCWANWIIKPIFCRILVDQTTEEMTNKDTQKAFSLNACVVSRYYMTFGYRKYLPLESEAYGLSPDIRICSSGAWATQDAKKSIGK